MMKGVTPIKYKERVALKDKPVSRPAPMAKPIRESSVGLVARTYGLDQSVYGVNQTPSGPHSTARMSYEWKTKRGGWHRRKEG